MKRHLKKQPPPKVFRRADWSIRIQPAELSEMLLALCKRGWQPDFPVHSFLGSFQVSEARAESLRAVGQKLLDDALLDPLSVYPVRFDMGKLAELVTFCEAGSFEVASEHAG